MLNNFSIRDKILSSNSVHYVEVSSEAQFVSGDLLANTTFIALRYFMESFGVTDSIGPRGKKFIAGITPTTSIRKFYQMNISRWS